jgi:hypothetical protein
MLNRLNGADPAGKFRRICASSALSACLFGIWAAGCGGPGGDITASKESRARIVSDADADGNITLPKTRNPRRKAAGLNTAHGIMDKKAKAKAD